MLGADILSETLHREGITHVFGLPGTTIMSILDALARRDDLRYISTRHEHVAGFKPITKWAVEVHDPARIPELVQRAVRMATSGRPGPVLVSVPMDAQTRDTEPAFQPYFRPAPPAPDPAALHRAAALLRAATRPAIIIGGGLLRGGYHPGPHELATVLRAPVVTTWLRKNAVRNDADYFCGSLGYGAPVVTEDLVRDADVILALGCRFSEFTTKRYTLLNSAS